MSTPQDIADIVASAHALARIAAQRTGNQEPAAKWRALSVLRREGPLRLGELAAASRTTQPGMTRMVAQLVEHDLVERHEDPQDSRATILSLTPTGDRALTQWQEQLRDAIAPLFDGLDAPDRAALARTAELLAQRTAPLPAVTR